MDLNQLIAPTFALIGTAVGAWVVDHFAGKRWLGQQQWAGREKYFAELLTQLTKAEVSLTEQSTYYIQPGSEYRDLSDDERFNRLRRTAANALEAVQELAGPAQIHVSQKTIDALKELAIKDWHAAFSSSHPSEYIDNALPLVCKAKQAVVSEAKAQLSSG